MPEHKQEFAKAQHGTTIFGKAADGLLYPFTVDSATGAVLVSGSPITADYDTGAGTQNMPLFGIALPASGGGVAGGTATAPLRVDPTGTTTQPVSLASGGAVTETTGTITAGGTRQQALAANASRKLLIVYNDDATEVLRYRFGGNASAASAGIAPGGSLLLDVAVPTGTLDLIAATTGHKFAIAEG